MDDTSSFSLERLQKAASNWTRRHSISQRDTTLVKEAATFATPLLTSVELLLSLDERARRHLIELFFFLPGSGTVLFNLPHGWLQIARAAELPEEFIAKQIYLRVANIRTAADACEEAAFLNEITNQPDQDNDGYMRFMTEEQATSVAWKLWFLRRGLIDTRFEGDSREFWNYVRQCRPTP